MIERVFEWWEAFPSLPRDWARGLLLIWAWCAWSMVAWGWVMPLDFATLSIHEAGHPLTYLVLGERMAVYGGTWAQLLFPLAFGVSFWRAGKREGVGFCWIWEATSLANVARYCADARAQLLPLVGGGGPNGEPKHDWAEILGRWGLLNWDGELALLMRLACILMMALCLGWLIRAALAPPDGPTL